MRQEAAGVMAIEKVEDTELSVLVVEDSRAINSLLCAQLKDQGNMKVESATSLEEARQLLVEDSQRFFVSVLDLNLPDAPNGEVVDLVQQSGIPVIVLTGNLDESIREQMLKRRLVDYVLKRNTSEIEYISSLVALIRDNAKRKVLVVDDSASFRSYLKNLLAIHRYQLLEAGNGRQALEVLQANPDIQLIITDYHMPEMNGAELVEQVRHAHGREDLAIIGMSNPTNKQLSAQLLKAGANDFISKPFEIEEFYCRVSQNVGTIARIGQIRDAATRDFLTGVCNRRHLFDLGERLYANARRGNFTLAAAMVDADHFKRVNDAYGHQAGDRALVALADTLQRSLRDSDVVARFGGEEFACLVICADRPGAEIAFERIRHAIEALEIPLADGVLKITASIGVTLGLSTSLEKMLADADTALYRAKDGGRNRIVFF